MQLITYKQLYKIFNNPEGINFVDGFKNIIEYINENFVSKGDYIKLIKENEKLKLILNKLEKNWKEKL